MKKLVFTLAFMLSLLGVKAQNYHPMVLDGVENSGM